MRRVILLLVVAVLALSAVTTASASRRPTNDEESSIDAAVVHYGNTLSLAGHRYPLTILTINVHISTINARWAGGTTSFVIGGIRHHGEPLLLHRAKLNGLWNVVRLGAYGDDCRFEGMPKRIQRELHTAAPCS